MVKLPRMKRVNDFFFTLFSSSKFIVYLSNEINERLNKTSDKLVVHWQGGDTMYPLRTLWEL